ncbi:proton-coupled folate transporter-like [Gigantopelta aegis]|uniref:proton-coupled folate transporter-like n=1 Tax=Gigantopelta aegis TaxID=1735272 RepID=UPI001B88BD71|nr:proton-coupled folate transporter-like [Gigantopelta aegis]
MDNIENHQMTEPTDETTLLGNDKPVFYGDDIKADTTIKGDNSRCVLIELVAGLFALMSVIDLQSTQFYIYDRVSETKHMNATAKASVCDISYENSTAEKIETEIQTEASTVLMFLIFASSFPAILPTLYFGTLTAKYGRKLAIRCSLIGFLIKNLVHVAVYYWKFSLYYLVLGNAIEGLLGAYGGAMVAIFGMVADVTPENHARSFRMTTVGAVLSLSASLGNGVSGVLIEGVGYVVIGIILTVVGVINVLYVECCLPETFTASSSAAAASTTQRVPFIESVKRSFTFYFRDTLDKRRSKMILCFLSFFLLVGFFLVNLTTLTLYLLNKPFCWTKIHITVFGALWQLVSWSVILVFTRTLRHAVADVGMMLIACVSGLASQVMMAFASVDGLVYGAAAVGVLSQLYAPMARAIMSKMVTPLEQGPLFAGLAVMEVVCIATLSTLATVIYRQTVAIFPGTVFLVVAAVIFVVIILVTILAFKTKKDTRERMK